MGDQKKSTESIQPYYLLLSHQGNEPSAFSPKTIILLVWPLLRKTPDMKDHPRFWTYIYPTQRNSVIPAHNFCNLEKEKTHSFVSNVHPSTGYHTLFIYPDAPNNHPRPDWQITYLTTSIPLTNRHGQHQTRKVQTFNRKSRRIFRVSMKEWRPSFFSYGIFAF